MYYGQYTGAVDRTFTDINGMTVTFKPNMYMSKGGYIPVVVNPTNANLASSVFSFDLETFSGTRLADKLVFETANIQANFDDSTTINNSGVVTSQRVKAQKAASTSGRWSIPVSFKNTTALGSLATMNSVKNVALIASKDLKNGKDTSVVRSSYSYNLEFKKYADLTVSMNPAAMIGGSYNFIRPIRDTKYDLTEFVNINLNLNESYPIYKFNLKVVSPTPNPGLVINKDGSIVASDINLDNKVVTLEYSCIDYNGKIYTQQFKVMFYKQLFDGTIPTTYELNVSNSRKYIDISQYFDTYRSLLTGTDYGMKINIPATVASYTEIYSDLSNSTNAVFYDVNKVATNDLSKAKYIGVIVDNQTRVQTYNGLEYIVTRTSTGTIIGKFNVPLTVTLPAVPLTAVAYPETFTDASDAFLSHQYLSGFNIAAQTNFNTLVEVRKLFANNVNFAANANGLFKIVDLGTAPTWLAAGDEILVQNSDRINTTREFKLQYLHFGSANNAVDVKVHIGSVAGASSEKFRLKMQSEILSKRDAEAKVVLNSPLVYEYNELELNANVPRYLLSNATFKATDYKNRTYNLFAPADARVSTTNLPKIIFADSRIQNEYIDELELVNNGAIKVLKDKTEKMQHGTTATINLKLVITDKFGVTGEFPFSIKINAKKN
jgi:hypothetical protein